MATIPESVAVFLAGKRIAVAGVSRDPNQAANAIFRRLRETGHETIPVNPHATELEGVPCYRDIASIPGTIDGLMVATTPDVTMDLVRQCSDRGIKNIWFHRSFGAGSVSDAAVQEAKQRGMNCLVGGCPLMYTGKVDPFHKCVGAWLRWRHRGP